MMKTGMNVEAGTADAELVTKTREGNRDAFGQIVSRYQSLICSLAYSATGSLGPERRPGSGNLHHGLENPPALA